MISANDTHISLPEGIASPDTWTPGNVCPITPTVVFLCGIATDREAEAFRSNVSDRLGGGVPADTVRWGRLGLDQEVSADTIRQIAGSLLGLAFWEDLVSRGLLTDVPQPLRIQFITVCDVARGNEATATRLVLALAKAAQEALAERAQLAMTLLVLGDGVPSLGDDAPYWPCIRLQIETYSGAVTERGRLIEVAQTIVVALLTSEVLRTLESTLGTDRRATRWISMGASALIADVVPMREYLRLAVLEGSLRPLVGDPLLLNQKQQLAKTTKARIVDLQSRTEIEAKHSIKDVGEFRTPEPVTGQMHATPSPQTRLKEVLVRTRAALGRVWELLANWGELRRVRRRRGRAEEQAPRETFELTEKLRGLLDFPPGSLDRDLANTYLQARNDLVQNLAQVANQEYGRLMQYLAALLDSRFDYKDPKDQYQVELRELRETCPEGLPTVIHALECASAELLKLPDMIWDGEAVQPHPMEADDYLEAVAHADAEAIHGHYRRYDRLIQTLLSPPGLLLKLVPAWVILSGILRVVGQMADWRAMGTAALWVALIGIAETIGWYIEVQQHKKRILADNTALVRTAVLRLIPMAVRDYRQLMLKYLNELLSALKGLQAVLVNRRAEVQRRLTFLDAKYEVPPQEVATAYRLADLNECRKWADQALEIRSPSGAPHGKGASARIIERILLPGQSDAYYRAAYDVEQEAESRADATFREDSLVPDALADKKQPLKGSGRWQWLFSKAQPLGRPRSADQPSFAIFTLASDAPRMGDSGRPLRENNWLVARSCQPHEIICLRGFVGAA